MEKPTKILIGGAILAAIVTAGGVANTNRLESKLDGLKQQCLKLIGETGLNLLCSKKELIRHFGSEDVEKMPKTFQKDRQKYPDIDVQVSIAETEEALRSSREWWPRLASTILSLSALPWAWYFLLRRIREVRDAIVGKQGV